MEPNDRKYYIEEELKSIDNKWLQIHYKTAVGVVIAAFIMECIMGVVLYHLGQIHTTIRIYIYKYIIVPVFVQAFATMSTYFIMNISIISQKVKVYAVSSLFVIICFVLFSVHSIFNALYLIFTVPILMTIIYNDYILTTFIALLSMIAKVGSELFIFWDADKINIMNDGTAIANFMISVAILFGFYATCIVVMYFEREKQSENIKKEIERFELKQRILVDELTGISNRAKLNLIFKEMDESDLKSKYTFVMIDLDNFKLINDTFGHSSGDDCLQKFSKLLVKYTKSGEAFRFGGDEFCVIFHNLEVNEIIDRCKLLQNDFATMVSSRYKNIPLSLSIGIAVCNNDISTYRLFRNADAALYKAKARKNSIHIFDSYMDLDKNQR